MEKGYKYLQMKSCENVLLAIIFLVISFLMMDWGYRAHLLQPSLLNAIICSGVIYISWKYFVVTYKENDSWAYKVVADAIWIIVASSICAVILWLVNTKTQLNQEVSSFLVSIFPSDAEADKGLSIVLYLFLAGTIVISGLKYNETEFILLRSVWEKVWYLTEDAPNSEKGEAWIFHKNGKLTITSPLKENRDITETYTWKYNPKMNSIAIVSEQRTQIFLNISVNTSASASELAFTTNQPDTLYKFSDKH